jgi:hypothetical protein
METAGADPDALILDAAKGGQAAQTQLCQIAFEHGNQGRMNMTAAVTAAEIFARMAAAHGDQGSRFRLAGVLMLCAGHAWNMGDSGESSAYQIEAVVLLNTLADEGNEEAATSLATLIPELAPDIISAAADAARGAAEPRDPVQ